MNNPAIKDNKLHCVSVMETMQISEYLKIVKSSYENKGAIQGQRDALRQKTAITIRKRMIDDIKSGTILPPVVIGVIVASATYEEIIQGLNSDNYSPDIFELIKNAESVSIIDGMQRTTAIQEALETCPCVDNNPIRVEFWISTDINSLLYRMLVLNTGQVPWNMRRQVEIVFGGIISTIKKQVDNIEVIEIDDGARRKKGGQFNANDLIEMFLAFGARTWKIDTREKLTDEFTRGDFLQSAGETDIIRKYCEVLHELCALDIKLDSVLKEPKINTEGKYSKGKDLFASQPAKIGFCAACGERILGRPGQNFTSDQIDERCDSVVESIQNLIQELDKCTSEIEAEEFLDLSTLSDVTEKKVGKVGDYERDLFYSAFKVLFEQRGQIDSLTVCWRA